MTTFQLHKYQEQAFTSDKRIIVIAAGIQSGKTTTGALWVGTKAGQISPDSNLIICAPTYKILTQATLPKFLQVFKRFGRYHKVDSIFQFHSGPTAFIRSLTDPNALEGITDVEAIWLDEGGLISRYAWENVEGRSAFRQAPILISTTPYALNWMFRMWEEWGQGKRPEVEFVQFTSKDNPHFPDEEFERQRRLLDSRRFQMKYMGQFGKMEGLVYEKINTCKSFKLEPGTKYYAGVDWGYTNPFVLSIRAVTPNGLHYRVAEFYKSGLMVEEIVRICQQRKQIYNIELFIADPSAPANIEALNRGGVTCIPGNNNVRAGIDEQNRLFKEERFFIFEDDNPCGIDEYSTYHYPEPRDYKIDEDQKEPEPVKANDHGCDADRYVTMHLVKADKIHMGRDPANMAKMPEDIIKRREWLIKGGSSRFGT
jgi:PBSX family phage terminase large subunit